MLDVCADVADVVVAGALPANPVRRIRKRGDRRDGFVGVVGAQGGDEIRVGRLHVVDGGDAVTRVVALVVLQHRYAASDVGARVTDVVIAANAIFVVHGVQSDDD